jgi:hypothetical protein
MIAHQYGTFARDLFWLTIALRALRSDHSSQSLIGKCAPDAAIATVNKEEIDRCVGNIARKGGGIDMPQCVLQLMQKKYRHQHRHNAITEGNSDRRYKCQRDAEQALLDNKAFMEVDDYGICDLPQGKNYTRKNCTADLSSCPSHPLRG